MINKVEQERISAEREQNGIKLRVLQQQLSSESKKRHTLEAELNTVMNELQKEKLRSDQRLEKLRRLVM